MKGRLTSKFKNIILLLALHCILPSLNAQNYCIVKLWNCKSIQIGNKKLKKGDIFNGRATIQWTNARQLIEVKEVNKNQVYKITGLGFQKHNAKSLSELLFNQKSLGHRSFTDGEKYYQDNDYFLADSLHIPTLGESSKTSVAEAKWEYEEKEIITRIEKTADGKFYIITPAIFADKVPQDVMLNIQERDTELDWINNVYYNIPIMYIPSNPQPIGFSGILLAKRQNSFYCTYFLHNRNVADTKSPYPIKRLEVIRWFNQKSMVFNQSLS